MNKSGHSRSDVAQEQEHHSIRRVRAWYGLPAEIVIEGDYWHWVKVGSVPVPHPPLINLIVRRGLPREERLALSYRHEFGHVQTLPFALLHMTALWFLWAKSRFGASWPRAARLLAAFVVHEATWELMAEGYVALRTGRRYLRIHRRKRAFLAPAVVWGTFAVMAWWGLAPALGTRRRAPLKPAERSTP